MTGLALRPSIGLDHNSRKSHKALAIKPGSAGKAMPGFDVRIVDDEGNELKERGKMGNIVLATPLAPTGFTTLFNDDGRFYKGYLKRFEGKWLDTGDAGMIDEDGYVHVMSRSDDIINVAAHRFSTGKSSFHASAEASFLSGNLGSLLTIRTQAQSNKQLPLIPQ
jgi:propionyl-CoA synthetase